MRYSLSDIEELFNLPFWEVVELVSKGRLSNPEWNTVQLNAALSIKTGACPEDCTFCPQSAHYKTFVSREAILEAEQVVPVAQQAYDEGAIEFCLGAAWRRVPRNRNFDRILAIVHAVKTVGIEVCASMGTVSYEQAVKLKEAGVSHFNHNLDTSPEYYPKVITTRPYSERLESIENIQAARLGLSCGGIIGMGESVRDRMRMLQELANLKEQPDIVPLNAFVAVEGTPLAKHPFIDAFEYARVIAVARLLMPNSIISLAAGVMQMSEEMKKLAFVAGANGAYTGKKILQTETASVESIKKIIYELGMTIKPQRQKFAA
jgi:biotin synthase